MTAAAPSFRTLQREAALADRINGALTVAKQDAAIHWASCRWRRQNLACSTCADTVERVQRLMERMS